MPPPIDIIVEVDEPYNPSSDQDYQNLEAEVEDLKQKLEKV